MSTPQLTNSSNLTASTDVYFAGVSQTGYTMPWSHNQWGSFERSDALSIYLVYRATGQDTLGLLHAGSYLVQPMPNRWHPFKQKVTEPAQTKPVSAKSNKHTSLANRYAKPGVSYSDEEIRATLKEIRSQWEEDFDERFDTNP